MSTRRRGLALTTTLTAALGTALTTSAAADPIDDLCPHPGDPASQFHAGPISPITNGHSLTTVEMRWYSPGPSDPPSSITGVVGRADGYRAHQIPFQVTPRAGGGNDVYISDASGYGPKDTGRWKIHLGGTCPDAYFYIFAESQIVDEVPLEPVLAGSTVAVGSTMRGWMPNGFEDPVPGVLVDIDRSPNVTGYPHTDVARTRTDNFGRARTRITVYSNTRIYQDNVLETTSRHDPAAVQAPTILVRKRITQAISDLTPAVRQPIKVAGTVYPAKTVQPVYLQRWNGRAFLTIANGQTSASARGRYTFTYTPTSKGRQVLRIYTPYDAWHVSSASPNAYLTTH